MIQSGVTLENRYEIIREIGKGGTGIIFLAYHRSLRKYVVVKKIMENYVGNIDARSEVDILKGLHHRGLPQVYDFIQYGNIVYTVMDYIEGQDLQHLVDEGSRFSEDLLHRWLYCLCEVLEYLHTRTPAIIHSDIKPSNLMVTPEGEIVLIDFNISLEGGSSAVPKGLSPYYAAPEQYAYAHRRKDSKYLAPIGPRTDLYSLGATFYYLMSGRLPSPYEDCLPLGQMSIPYSEGFRAVVDKAMRKQPSMRFQSAGRMKRSLQELEKQDPVFHRLSLLQLLISLLGALIVCMGIFLLYYGVELSSREAWREGYREFAQYCNEQDEEKLQESGRKLLNESAYRRYLRTHEEDRSMVLHAIGESYYRTQQYGQAQSYYAESVKDSENPEYYEDYAIALAKNGETQQAIEMLDRAEALGLERAEVYLAQAQMYLLSGRYKAALDQLELVKAKTSDSALLYRAALLENEVYEGQGEREAQEEVLRYAMCLSDDAEARRRLGALYIQEVEQSGAAQEKLQWAMQAVECYEELAGRGGATYEDRLNLAIAQNIAQRPQKSRELLEEMEIEWPQDYRILLWECLDLIDLRNQGLNISQMDLETLYQRCLENYEKRSEAQTDERMEALIAYMAGNGAGQ